MEWRKPADGERVSTAVFMGMTPLSAEEKCQQLLACEHDWKPFGEKDQNGNVIMETDACLNCQGTRIRLTGPEADLVKTLEGSDEEDDHSDR